MEKIVLQTGEEKIKNEYIKPKTRQKQQQKNNSNTHTHIILDTPTRFLRYIKNKLTALVMQNICLPSSKPSVQTPEQSKERKNILDEVRWIQTYK